MYVLIRVHIFAFTLFHHINQSISQSLIRFLLRHSTTVLTGYIHRINVIVQEYMTVALCIKQYYNVLIYCSMYSIPIHVSSSSMKKKKRCTSTVSSKLVGVRHYIMILFKNDLVHVKCLIECTRYIHNNIRISIYLYS